MNVVAYYIFIEPPFWGLFKTHQILPPEQVLGPAAQLPPGHAVQRQRAGHVAGAAQRSVMVPVSFFLCEFLSHFRSHFWTGIFKLAKDRAIVPALVDWNVFVSDAYKQHYDKSAHSDKDGGSGPATVTALADQYNRECITQTLQEYPDLEGIGLSLGDRVSNLNLTQQLTYAADVIIAGVQAAGRPVKLIYRAPFGEGPGSSNSPAVARKHVEASGIPAGDLFVQIKFNWSHGHSTVKFVQAHGGGTGAAYYEPPSDKCKFTKQSDDACDHGSFLVACL